MPIGGKESEEPIKMESNTFTSTVPTSAICLVDTRSVATIEEKNGARDAAAELSAGLVDNDVIAASAGARLHLEIFSANYDDCSRAFGGSCADAKGDGTRKIKKCNHGSDTGRRGFPIEDFSTGTGFAAKSGNLGMYSNGAASTTSRFYATESEAVPVGIVQTNNFASQNGTGRSNCIGSCIFNPLDSNVGDNRNIPSNAGLFAVFNEDASNDQSNASQTATTMGTERNNSDEMNKAPSSVKANPLSIDSSSVQEKKMFDASPTTNPIRTAHEKHNDSMKTSCQSSKDLDRSARNTELLAKESMPATFESQKAAPNRIPRKAPKLSEKTPNDSTKSSIGQNVPLHPKVMKRPEEAREENKKNTDAISADSSHKESADLSKSSSKAINPSKNPVKEPYRRSSSRKRVLTHFYADEQAVDRVKSTSKRKGGERTSNGNNGFPGNSYGATESGELGFGDERGNLNEDENFRQNDKVISAINEDETNRNDYSGGSRMHDVDKRKSRVEGVSKEVKEIKIAMLDFSDRGAGCKELEKLGGEENEANYESSNLGDDGIDEASIQCHEGDNYYRRKRNKSSRRGKPNFDSTELSAVSTPNATNIESEQPTQRESLSEPVKAIGGENRKRRRKDTSNSFAQERTKEELDEIAVHRVAGKTASTVECDRPTNNGFQTGKIKPSREKSEMTSKKNQANGFPLPKESRLRRISCVKGEQVKALGPGMSASRAIRAHVGTRLPTKKISKDMQSSRTRNACVCQEDSNLSQSVNAVKLSAQCKGQMKTFAKGLPPAPQQGWHVYEEESAWRFHNPDFPQDGRRHLNLPRADQDIPHMVSFKSDEELLPLPPPPPLPQLPDTGDCTWSYNDDTRVVHANFHSETIHHDDQKFLLKMMERDDITVISEGLAGNLDQSLWKLGSISGRIGSDFHHKIRVFHKSQYKVGGEMCERFVETKEWYRMRVSDYFKYLAIVSGNQMACRDRNKSSSTALKGTMPPISGAKRAFVFHDCDGGKHTINDVDNVALYAVDLDLVKLLPWLHKDFERNFKLPDILPGGRHCMMDAVNPNGRPFMGPNLYITPPGTYTHIHQDGHGTVDSGHFCLSGYNEVVMIRRLVERRKIHAVEILMGKSLRAEDILYGLPHSEDQISQWPTKDAIKKCEEMGYCPSVFILKPGQMVHINKGRIHAFRKMSSVNLAKTDCHFALRDRILSSLHPSESLLCVSIAWDWMYKGITPEGINREVSSILECARLNSSRRLQSLAIPETTLLYLAKNVIADFRVEENDTDKSLILPKSARICHEICIPSPKEILRGILPSLQFVISKHSSAARATKNCQLRGGHDKLEIISKPNTHENPDVFALDPYGSSDFFCKICMEELSNVYLHCMGCEKLLGKDFNICVACHSQGKYRDVFQMHPFDNKRRAELNHTGNMKRDNKARCPCRNGRLCTYCGYCTGCSCKCHRWFGLYYRFMSIEEELDLLSQAEKIVGSKEILHATETKARLFSLGTTTIRSSDDVTSFSAPQYDFASTIAPSFVGRSTAIEGKATAELSTQTSSLPHDTAASIMGSQFTASKERVAEGAFSELNSTDMPPDQLHELNVHALSFRSDDIDIAEHTSPLNTTNENDSKKNSNLGMKQKSTNPNREKTTVTAAGHFMSGERGTTGGSEPVGCPVESMIAIDTHFSTHDRNVFNVVQSPLDFNHDKSASVMKTCGNAKKSYYNHEGKHGNSPPKKKKETIASSTPPMFEEGEKKFDVVPQNHNDNSTPPIETSIISDDNAATLSYSTSVIVSTTAMGNFGDHLSSTVQQPVMGSSATGHDGRSTTKFETAGNKDALKYSTPATCNESATTIQRVGETTFRNIQLSDEGPSANTFHGKSTSMPKTCEKFEDETIFNNGIDNSHSTQHIHCPRSEDAGFDVMLHRQNSLTGPNKTSFTCYADAAGMSCSPNTVVAKTAVGDCGGDQRISVQEPVMGSSAAGDIGHAVAVSRTFKNGEEPTMDASRDVGNITLKDIDASGAGSSVPIDGVENAAVTKPCDKPKGESKVNNVDESGSIPSTRCVKIISRYASQKLVANTGLDPAKRKHYSDIERQILGTTKGVSHMINDYDSDVSSLCPDDLTVGSRVDVEFKNKVWQADVLCFDKTNSDRLKIHFVGSKQTRSQWISFRQVKRLVCDKVLNQRNDKGLKLRQKLKHEISRNVPMTLIFDNVDWNKRCSSLIPSCFDSVKPTSKYDIFPSMIAFTAPCGDFDLLKESSTVDEMTQCDLEGFILHAKSLPVPTVKDILNYLPTRSKLNKNTVIHLFRNFSDCEIDGPEPANKRTEFFYTRREIDVMNFLVLTGRGYKDAAKLIPYRPIENLDSAMKILKDKGHWKDEGYANMLQRTVQIIWELER